MTTEPAPAPALPPTVAFASDYGHLDPFVGLCHLAMRDTAATLGSSIDVVDLCHTLPAYDTSVGAVLLADALPWVPPHTVVLAVVDPGVGTDRAGVVVQVGDDAHHEPGPLLLVGADNGLLVAAAGDALRFAWRIPDPPRPWRVAGEPVAATFDGRDVFAPLAARLAVDADAALAGLTPIGTDELVALALPGAEVAPGWIDAQVVRADGFGNLALSAGASALEAAGWRPGQRLRVHVGEHTHHATAARAFAELGEGRLGVLADAFGRLQIVVDRGNAAEALGARAGTPVTIATDRG